MITVEKEICLSRSVSFRWARNSGSVYCCKSLSYALSVDVAAPTEVCGCGMGHDTFPPAPTSGCGVGHDTLPPSPCRVSLRAFPFIRCRTFVKLDGS
jgi:hypothetical protein